MMTTRNQEQIRADIVAALPFLRSETEIALDALAGDSNDAEHEALYSLVMAAQELLVAAGIWGSVVEPESDDYL